MPQPARKLVMLACALVLALPLAARAGDNESANTKEVSNMALTLTSTAFVHQGEMPMLYTCEGRNISPPLAWADVPANARSLALIADDPDAPDPAKPLRTFVHWVVYNLPATAGTLPEATSTLPGDARSGVNDAKRPGYTGPCPPIGRHRYFFKLYALDTVLPDLGTPTKAQLEDAMRGHVVAQTELLGTYQKQR